MKLHTRALAPAACAVLTTTTFAGPCPEPPTFDQGLTPTTIIHVAETGSDTTGDGSPTNPYASIEFAADNATPGTAIRIHAGTYPGGDFITDLAGTQSAPIWIGGAPGEPRPLISGGSEGLHLTRVRWLILHDLEVTGAAFNGVNCDDGGDRDNPDATRHIIFRNLSIHDIGGAGNQ
ncbi:MAG: hypothetical protein VYC34_04225, partial [Planctomycetota bacterium]|nr:hypothetical protein [Planctomycetota bacterium]